MRLNRVCNTKIGIHLDLARCEEAIHRRKRADDSVRSDEVDGVDRGPVVSQLTSSVQAIHCREGGEAGAGGPGRRCRHRVLAVTAVPVDLLPFTGPAFATRAGAVQTCAVAGALVETLSHSAVKLQ